MDGDIRWPGVCGGWKAFKNPACQHSWEMSCLRPASLRLSQMTRFQEKTSPILYLAIGVGIIAVYLADRLTPVGIAVFVTYMVPLVLAFYTWRPIVPFWVAGISGSLMFVDVFLDGDLSPLGIARRVIGAVSLLSVALIGYQFICTRLGARRERWVQEGQTRISERLAGDHRLEELGERVLGFLGDYLGANVGAIFIEDGGIFRRCATYAAAAGSVPTRFSSGEGLLGQAVKDGRTVVVNDVPDGYLKLGSVLGNSAPRHLLVVPMKLEGVVNTVVEMGFFKPITASDLELFERIDESVATAVRSVKYRSQLQELLEETQRQSEEVQAQSEELRVSNEELEEQGRALRESQSRLELQQAELEQTNTQLEEQALYLERQRNDLLEAKQNLEIQARQVEQASQYKSDFLANMSHELRTPLNSSLILAKLLGENRTGNLTPEQVKYAITIESAGNDLLALINDVLDLSKIEAGHMEIHTESVQVERIIRDLHGTFDPVAGQKGLVLEMDVAVDAPQALETDPQRLEQVLKNLLSNALKFTAQGSVTLRVRRAPGDRIAFAVIDSGIGIPADKQRIIFDPFFQADGTTNRKYGGTGLGLSISRNLVRLLGGEIQLESEPGHGSTFTLYLPLTHESGEENSKQQIPARELAPTANSLPSTYTPGQVPDDREVINRGSRVILTVEDDEPFTQIIYDLAHEMNFQCLIATSAEEGLMLARQHVPSAIVLDVGLPDTSGLTVLERLKADPHTRHIPVHVVSANDFTQTAMALGAVGYMMKPVKRDQLVETFLKLETRLTQKMRRVLVVEDDPVQVAAMRDLLASRDVETVCAQSAAECLEHLKTTTFDCMVLDLSLPDSSGFALLEKLSAEQAYGFPPVIVYTGRVLSADEEQRLRRYSKSIIIKGAKSPERLLDEVTLFLHQVVSDLPPEKQRMLEKSSGRDAALEGRRILIAEDDVRNVFALTSLLEGRGVQLEIARNGHEALAALEMSQQDTAKAVDLVLMDIMMPEMDGLTAMREIRKRREWKKLPIIALTAKAMKNDQEQCLEAGANDYLAKPLDVEKLLSLIRVWMPR
jgi:signal transduction histidine kinase/DNA-binding response OmpR family regulator